MSSKILKTIVALGAVALLSSACSLTTVNNSTGQVSATGVNSSVFFSTNSGDNWRPVNSIPTTNGQTLSLNGLNVKTLRADPVDSSAIYLATYDQGLYYTYNINNGWNHVAGLPLTTINDVQVDPKSKCIIYAAVSNRLYRSTDCTRNWDQVYFDSSASVSVNTIVVDHTNPHNIYIGTSRGEIIKSIDGGNSWRTINRLNNGVARLIISPLDSGLLFAATVKNEIFSFSSNSRTNAADLTNIDQNFSIDNWTDLNDVLSSYNLGQNFRDIIITPYDGLIFLITDKLILRSPDQGITWENIKLIQPPTDTIIKAIAVNPQKSSDLYYVTNTTLFRSTDAGVSWNTQSLPSGRIGQSLVVDAQHPNNIYLGTIKLAN